jgi:hypothetical protein
VDDRESYLKTADEIGMKPVLFNSRDIQYEGTVINSFAELAEILL